MREPEQDARTRALQLFREGYSHQMRGELEKAIALYQESIELYPMAESHTFLGWTYSFQGRWQDAIEECLRAIEVDPSFGNPYNDIGAYLMELGRDDEALDWFHKALRAERYESYCLPHFNLGRLYERKRQFHRALEEYAQAVRENPKHLGALKGWTRLKGSMN